MRLTIILTLLFALSGALIFGALTWIRSEIDFALYKGVVFFVAFGIIGWGLSYIVIFFKPELLGRETILKDRENVDYVFPDEEEED